LIKVTDDIQNFRFNTAIAALMELNNTLIRLKETLVYGSPIWHEAIQSLVLMMAPIFPHISEELWRRLGHTESVHLQQWPQGDAEKAREEDITVVVQVNGRVRDKLVVALDTAESALQERALGMENIQKWIDGKDVRKVIVVPNKLVNIVIGS
jgi:leucyl-tRNA synthetase